jgi:hypothetical protein
MAGFRDESPRLWAELEAMYERLEQSPPQRDPRTRVSRN